MPSLHRAPLLLELDLTSPLLEVEPEDLLGKLRTRGRPRMRAILRALYEAGSDGRVRALIVKVGGGSGLSWPVMQELRAGLIAFAGSGKPTVAWAESFGEAGNGTVGYVLATGCPRIWLQPSGEVGWQGVAVETTFLRGALDKLGVEPQLDQRHEYKSVADRIMRSDYTPAHREAVDRVAASTWDSAVAAVAAARRLAPGDVAALTGRAPLSAEDARAAGLIDSIGYRDEVYAAVRAEVGGKVQPLFADQWQPRRRAAALVRRSREVVAVVEAVGEIAVGRSRSTPRGPQVGSSTVGAALRAARADDHVRAVLLRVDSPGGSAVASDTIWREVELTKRAGKPVIVSMSTLAASGGYYISCPADVIVAQPTTITGSIGVVAGKVVATELLERLGLTTDSVEHGRGARMFSWRRGFDADERERLAEMLDRVYEQFVQRVADGRAMSTAAVESVARGRIWTGADAAGNGLVDTLGGYRDAADIARQRAGLRADAPLRPAVHVAPLRRLQRPRSSEDPRAASASADLTSLANVLGLPPASVLRMPPIRLV